MKRLLFIIFSLVIFISASAQSNPNDYRNLAAMHIWTQNCDKAQKCYNIYKELSGKSLEKMDVLIEQQCKGKYSDQYMISYDWTILMRYLESVDFRDKALILRVLNMYSDTDQKVAALKQFENVYEDIARGLDGAAWYESISVQKKL